MITRFRRCLIVLLAVSAVVALPLFGNGTAEKTATASSVELTPAGTYPVTKELMTIKAVIPATPQVIDYDTNLFTKWMQDKTNIKMEFQQIPSAQKEQKITLLLASGDYPEVFINSAITPAQETKYGTSEKIFLPLGDLIAKDAPNFGKALDLYPGLRGYITSPDGKIYSLPEVNECYHCTMSDKFWINQNWLDKLGLKTPTTIQQFQDVMTAFKNQDPNGNGKKDEIPMTGADDDWFRLFPYLMDPFILVGDDPLTLIEDRSTGKLVATFMQPAFRDGLTWINGLFKQGLIYGTSFTQNRDQIRSLAAQPSELLGGITVGGLLGVLNPNDLPDRYRHYAALAPLQGPGGRQTALYDYIPFQTGNFVITDKAKSPEAAIRWVDAYYTTEGELHGYYGQENVQWKYASKGEVGLTGEPAIYDVLVPFTQEPHNYNWFYHFYAPKKFWFGQAISPDLDPYTAAGLEKLLYQETKQKYEPYVSAKYAMVPPLRLNTDELQKMETVSVELKNYVSNAIVQFITGDMNIATDWDKYIAGLKNVGVDAYLATQQTAYDRQYK